jgi:hypothetical protein
MFEFPLHRVFGKRLSFRKHRRDPLVGGQERRPEALDPRRDPIPASETEPLWRRPGPPVNTVGTRTGEGSPRPGRGRPWLQEKGHGTGGADGRPARTGALLLARPLTAPRRISAVAVVRDHMHRRVHGRRNLEFVDSPDRGPKRLGTVRWPEHISHASALQFH